MRIAMFTNTYAPVMGGVEKSIETFVDDFQRLGHHVLVVMPTFPGHEESTDRILRVPSIQNVRGSPYSFRVPLPNLISDRIEEFRPDIIHSHQPFMLGDAALRAARQFYVPLVFTNHTLFERYAYVVPLESEGVLRVARQLPVEYANLCDQVIAPTEGVARILRERGLTTPVSVVPTGIDTSLFHGGDRPRARARWAIPPEAPVVGHVGRLTPEKNVDFLAQAMATVLRETPEAWTIVVGEGEAKQAMAAILSEAGVADRVVFTGKLTGQDLADAYASMDVFGFASKTDTQGIVLFEAQAAGLPIVALNAPGPQDIVRPEATGVLLPVEAPAEAFGGAIRDLLHDPKRRQGMAKRAWEDVQLNDRGACAARLLQVYDDVRARAGWVRDDITAWDRLLGRARAEWKLIEEKATLARNLFASTG